MLEIVKLLLPALIPSWRFFDVIAPSPRIEFALVESKQSSSGNWQEFRPRPLHLSFSSVLKRIFWNSRWNETLFLVSCADRLMENGSEHSIQEIIKRIKADSIATPYLQFRLVFVSRQGTQLQKRVTFISPIYDCRKNFSV